MFQRFGVRFLIRHDFLEDFDAQPISKLLKLPAIEGDMLSLTHLDAAQGRIRSADPVDQRVYHPCR